MDLLPPNIVAEVQALAQADKEAPYFRDRLNNLQERVFTIRQNTLLINELQAHKVKSPQEEQRIANLQDQINKAVGSTMVPKTETSPTQPAKTGDSPSTAGTISLTDLPPKFAKKIKDQLDKNK